MIALDTIQSALNDVENALRKLDALTADAEARRSTIVKLTAEISDLHSNKGNLDSKVRAAKLTSATALLALEEGDLLRTKDQIDLCSNHIVALERRAQGLLQQVSAAVRVVRRSAAEGLLEKYFDLQKLNTFAIQFADVAYSVLQVDEINDTLSHNRWLPAERDLVIDDARQLRPRSKALLEMAANELGDGFTIIDVQLMPVVKSKPVVVGNQLGTAMPAMVAA